MSDYISIAELEGDKHTAETRNHTKLHPLGCLVYPLSGPRVIQDSTGRALTQAEILTNYNGMLEQLAALQMALAAARHIDTVFAERYNNGSWEDHDIAGIPWGLLDALHTDLAAAHPSAGNAGTEEG